jgi:hypothetical protein
MDLRSLIAIGHQATRLLDASLRRNDNTIISGHGLSLEKRQGSTPQRSPPGP